MAGKCLNIKISSGFLLANVEMHLKHCSHLLTGKSGHVHVKCIGLHQRDQYFILVIGLKTVSPVSSREAVTSTSLKPQQGSKQTRYKLSPGNISSDLYAPHKGKKNIPQHFDHRFYTNI